MGQPMTTEEVANALVSLCRQGNEKEAVERYYHPDIVSVEASAMPGISHEIKGLDGVKTKHAGWAASFEMHGGNLEGPFVNGDQFTIYNTIDCTHKASGQRMAMSELTVYTVRDGKIVRRGILRQTGSGADFEIRRHVN